MWLSKQSVSLSVCLSVCLSANKQFRWHHSLLSVGTMLGTKMQRLPKHTKPEMSNHNCPCTCPTQVFATHRFSPHTGFHRVWEIWGYEMRKYSHWSKTLTQHKNSMLQFTSCHCSHLIILLKVKGRIFVYHYPPVIIGHFCWRYKAEFFYIYVLIIILTAVFLAFFFFWLYVSTLVWQPK